MITNVSSASLSKLTYNSCPSVANCPAGLYSTENETCDECPLGTYQPVQGQTECIPCGANLTTAFNGTVEEVDCIGNVSVYSSLLLAVLELLMRPNSSFFNNLYYNRNSSPSVPYFVLAVLLEWS